MEKYYKNVFKEHNLLVNASVKILEPLLNYDPHNPEAFRQAITGLPEDLKRIADNLSELKLNEYDDIEQITDSITNDAYTDWAKTYDTDNNQLLKLEEEVIHSIIGDVTGLRILDAGSGTGRKTIEFASKGASVIGIEPNEEMRQSAKLKRKERQLSEVSFLDGDVCSLSSSLGEFDLINCSLVLRHVSNPEKAINSMTQRLKPGGRITISVQHPYPSSFLPGLAKGSSPNKQYFVYKHQISDYINALAQNNCRINQIIEKIINKKLIGLPILLVIEARKE